MLIRNSIRQIMRTPVRTILFLLLLILASAMSTVGINLWQISSSNTKAFEKVFTTIGTVEQDKSVLRKFEEWDAIEQLTRYYYVGGYNAPIPVSVLNFEGANYIHQPEKRPFYGAYVPGYQLLPPKTSWGMDIIIVEFTVNEDCIPDHEIEINIGKQIYSRYPINIDTIWFCDRFNRNPEPLYAGRTYIMAMYNTLHRLNDSEFRSVFTPIEMLGSRQYTKEGELLPDDAQGILYEQVTEGFYETERGKRWLTLAENIERPSATIPVTATNSTKLLIPFYSGTAYVLEGSDISEEQYESGALVCLVPSNFARMNNLTVGDKINLPLYYADYRSSAGRAYGQSEMWSGFNLLNAKGESYSIFHEEEYIIVGVYMSIGGNSSGYTMAKNEVIIPSKSITSSDQDNIVAYGPMMGYTTSFQIPNGTMEEYMEAFQKLGIDELKITLYDKGYTKLKAGLDNIRNMSSILCAAGVIATVLILAFFCNLFITKQKKRTAIERSLGMSKWSCTQSMISGILLIVLIGSLVGSMTGFLLTKVSADFISGRTTFDTTYTMGSSSNSIGEEMSIGYSGSLFALSAITCVIIIILALVISLLVVRSNLKSEPLELLSERTE